MKPYEIDVPFEALKKPQYSCLFTNSWTKIPELIQSCSTGVIEGILSLPSTQKILMNCNQDVLLIMQNNIENPYQWEDFWTDELSQMKKDEMYPVAINNYYTGEPLFLATVTSSTLQMSLETGNLIMWSQFRNKLWIIGETSGDYLRLRELLWDPAKRVFFAKVFPETGGVCHEKIDSEGSIDPNGSPATTCFRRVLKLPLEFIS